MSELARLMAHINAEIEAAQRGLTGLSQGSANHAFITAKTEQVIDALTPLMKQVNALLANENKKSNDPNI